MYSSYGLWLWIWMVSVQLYLCLIYWSLYFFYSCRTYDLQKKFFTDSSTGSYTWNTLNRIVSKQQHKYKPKKGVQCWMKNYKDIKNIICLIKIENYQITTIIYIPYYSTRFLIFLNYKFFTYLIQHLQINTF